MDRRSSSPLYHEELFQVAHFWCSKTSDWWENTFVVEIKVTTKSSGTTSGSTLNRCSPSLSAAGSIMSGQLSHIYDIYLDLFPYMICIYLIPMHIYAAGWIMSGQLSHIFIPGVQMFLNVDWWPRLVYNQDTHTTSDAPGVETRWDLNTLIFGFASDSICQTQPKCCLLRSQHLKFLFSGFPGLGTPRALSSSTRACGLSPPTSPWLWLAWYKYH